MNFSNLEQESTGRNCGGFLKTGLIDGENVWPELQLTV